MTNEKNSPVIESTVVKKNNTVTDNKTLVTKLRTTIKTAMGIMTLSLSSNRQLILSILRAN